MAETAKKTISDYKMPGFRGPRRTGEVEKAENLSAVLKKMLSYFRREKRSVLVLFMVVLTGVVCSILSPACQSRAIDAIADKRFSDLPGILLFMGAVYAVSCLASYLQGKESAFISQRTAKSMRGDLFSRIIHLPVGYLDTHSHGDIMSRMTNDVENISTTISQSLSNLFSGVLTVLGTVGMMVYLCPPLALLSCTTVILTVLMTKYMSAAMRKMYTKRQILLGRLNAVVEEKVGSFRTVAAYGMQEKVREEFSSVSDDLTKVGIRSEILAGSMGPMMNLINNIGFVIIAAFGGYFALKGMISVGVISAFIVYAKQFGRPVDEIAQIWGQVQTALAGAERVFGVMEETPEDQSGTILMEEVYAGAPECRGAGITFENVDFSYVPGQRVLKNFSLTVRPGEKVALVGATGSGKTTVVNLLMRFYRPDSGRICINGTDIREIALSSLRDETAIVLQETVLFHDTVRRNLKYADPEVSDQVMISCAKQCHVDDTVRKLEMGYDTVLSADASNISQGQQQLLSIARAFVSRPRILILDEATSNVDTRTEKRIQDAMVKLMHGRTSLVIAHRLSTIRDADVIVVMDGGQVAESGTHASLMAARGKYYSLYSQQFAGQAT